MHKQILVLQTGTSGLDLFKMFCQRYNFDWEDSRFFLHHDPEECRQCVTKLDDQQMLIVGTFSGDAQLAGDFVAELKKVNPVLYTVGWTAGYKPVPNCDTQAVDAHNLAKLIRVFLAR